MLPSSMMGKQHKGTSLGHNEEEREEITATATVVTDEENSDNSDNSNSISNSSSDNNSNSNSENNNKDLTGIEAIMQVAHIILTDFVYEEEAFQRAIQSSHEEFDR